MIVPGGNWGMGAAVATLASFILLGTADRDGEVLEQATETPQTVRLADLASGAVKNRHVTVTEFVLGPRHVIVEKDGRWDIVWVPMHPPGGPAGRPPDVVVRSFRIRDKPALQRLYAQDRITGILMPNELSSEAAEVLAKAYEGLDRGGVVVLSEGRKFPSRRVVELSRLAGSVLIVVAVGCAVQAWRMRG